MKSNDFNNDVEIQWCPGCPNFSILKTLKAVLADLNKSPRDICLVSGIGQAAKLPHYLNCNFFNGLHGRALPVAQGVKAVQPQLTTLVTTGDGDCYGEGGNHFLHALRRNPDITVLVHNNAVYALTKGQASPTTRPGEQRTLPAHTVEQNTLNMAAIAISHDCGFVARSFATDQTHLADILKKAIRYRGLSYVDIIQPCITWGTRTVKWYKKHIYPLEDTYDPSDKAAALQRIVKDEEKIPVGVFFRAPEKAVFGDGFRRRVTDKPLTASPWVDADTIRSTLDSYYRKQQA